MEQSEVKYHNPEVMLYIIVELVGSTCYESILYDKPAPIKEMKEYINDSIRAIMQSQESK